MKEKLIIKNFGPIKSAELELGRFNILIGENATGKSTIAKLLAVCRYFSYIVGNDNHTIPSNAFHSGLIAWGLGENVKPNSYIYYKCEDYIFTATRIMREDIIFVDPDTSQTETYEGFRTEIFPESERFSHLLNELERIMPPGAKEPKGLYGYQDPFWTIPTSFFQNEVKRVMDNPFYLPTERGLQSIFSLGRNSIQNITDSLFNQLAKLDQIARSFKKATTIDPLNISYLNENGKGFIKRNNDNQLYSIHNTASGYQSTIPVVLLTKYYTDNLRRKKTFIIEEPELNLFPKAQNELMKYLVDRTMNYGNSMLLTTHSPYTLTSLNNMMYAYQLGQKHKEETNKILEGKYWINPDDVSAYMLHTDGTTSGIVEMEDILNRLEGMIHVSKIDSVSKILNEQFDQLIELEHNDIAG